MPERVPISWRHYESRLVRARNYWLATTRPDRRPHVAPVWGVWRDNLLYFGTDPGSVKGRNLAAEPRATVHLDDSIDVVLVEGVVATAGSAGTLTWYDDALADKYVTIRSGRPYRSSMNAGSIIYRFTPTVALTWWETAMTQTGRRWRFSGGEEPVAEPWHM